MNTRTHSWPRIAALALLFVMVRPVLAEDAVAMVSDLTGEAQVAEQGSTMPLSLLDYLYPGVELKLGPDATVTLVYFDSGVEYRFGAGARVRIAAGKPEVLAGKVAGQQDLQLAKGART